MKIRVTVEPDGQSLVESISALEDLWHDFTYFEQQADKLDQGTAPPTDLLVAKRYRRAALLSLLCYLEGVINNWLKQIQPEEWRRLKDSRESLESKVERIQALLPRGAGIPPDIRRAKKLRHTLVHLKPGFDEELYDGITAELLAEAKTNISNWLRTVETILSLKRHPDTRQESAAIRAALGTSNPALEGYTTED